VTHGQLAANLAAIRSATEHERIHGRVLSWLPLQHDLGLIGSLALPMSCGCSLVLQTTATFARRPASWLTAMSEYRITASTGPNFAYGLMQRLLASGLAVDLSSVRFLLCGAEPIDAATMARFAAAARPYGLDPGTLVPAYGLAEATLAVTFSPLGSGVRVDRVDAAELESRGRAVPADDGRSLVRLGPPVAGTSLRIVDPETGEPLPERRVGRVELCGPSVIGHYWGEAPPGPGAWLVSGDLGYLTDGELVICGREKDVLFAAGRNLFPQDVEAAAAEVTGLRLGRVVAFGVGERFVVAVESRASEAASVRAAVSAAVLAEVGLAPAEVLTVPFGRLPKTTSGKLRRAETRQRHLAGELVPPERTVR
jgi:fatty-acyl-CoA synthase